MKSITERLRFIRSVFGKTHLANNGVDVAVRCPSCSSKSQKKKLSINLETWQYHCWVCGTKGKDLSFILKKFSNPEDLSLYSSEFLDQKNTDLKIEDTVEVPKLPKDFILLADNLKTRDPDARSCLLYLKKRGLTKRDLWYFKLGTCKSGSHRRRIIVPSFDVDGYLNFYSSRAIDEGRIKYLNSKFDKRDIAFNEINVDWESEVTIVEGPFDLFKCNDNSTCLLGSSLGERHFLFRKIIANLTPVLLALDSDMIQKSFKIARLLSEYGSQVRIIDLVGRSDVGELTKKEFLSLRKKARFYDRNIDLISRIGSLRSGSII